MYSVYDNDRPARYPEIKVHPSWCVNTFETFQEACNYARDWLNLSDRANEVQFRLNEPYHYSGHDDYIVIREV